MTRIIAVLGNIVDQRVDVIINAANPQLLPGGGVCGAIHRAAGPELEEECASIIAEEGYIPVGEATLTDGYALSAKYVVHAVGPVYSGTPKDAELLENAYYSALVEAEFVKATSVAFPAISTGIYGYPMDEAAHVAVKAVREYLGDGPTTLVEVRFVLFDQAALRAFETALSSSSTHPAGWESFQG